MNICTYVNVGRMWETPEKCGKLAKKCLHKIIIYAIINNVENMWKTCGKHVEKCLKNVDKMWECGKLCG